MMVSLLAYQADHRLVGRLDSPRGAPLSAAFCSASAANCAPASRNGHTDPFGFPKGMLYCTTAPPTSTGGGSSHPAARR
jgi:hypothetical protein